MIFGYSGPGGQPGINAAALGNKPADPDAPVDPRFAEFKSRLVTCKDPRALDDSMRVIKLSCKEVHAVFAPEPGYDYTEVLYLTAQGEPLTAWFDGKTLHRVEEGW